jgi:hypothetical protein
MLSPCRCSGERFAATSATRRRAMPSRASPAHICARNATPSTTSTRYHCTHPPRARLTEGPAREHHRPAHRGHCERRRPPLRQRPSSATRASATSCCSTRRSPSTSRTRTTLSTTSTPPRSTPTATSSRSGTRRSARTVFRVSRTRSAPRATLQRPTTYGA